MWQFRSSLLRRLLLWRESTEVNQTKDQSSKDQSCHPSISPRGHVSEPFNVKRVKYLDLDLRWQGQGGELSRMMEVGDQIGKGGFSDVFASRIRETHAIYALKLFRHIHYEVDAALIACIQREMAVLKAVRHDHCVSYFGCLAEPMTGNLALIMELCDGGSVKDLLMQSSEKLREKHIAHIIRSVLLALKHLHSMGIVHRDVKAANMLLTTGGQVKLSDFGIAATKRPIAPLDQIVDNQSSDPSIKQSDDQSINQSNNQSNNQKGDSIAGGSPLWMAPESLNGADPADSTDVWSLGISCIEIAEGRPPNYRIQSVAEIIAVINTQSPPSLSTHAPSFLNPSQSFIAFVGACLVKDPSQRATVDQLLQHDFMTQFDWESCIDRVPSGQSTPNQSNNQVQSSPVARLGSRLSIPLSPLGGERFRSTSCSSLPLPPRSPRSPLIQSHVNPSPSLPSPVNASIDDDFRHFVLYGQYVSEADSEDTSRYPSRPRSVATSPMPHSPSLSPALSTFANSMSNAFDRMKTLGRTNSERHLSIVPTRGSSLVHSPSVSPSLSASPNPFNGSGHMRTARSFYSSKQPVPGPQLRPVRQLSVPNANSHSYSSQYLSPTSPSPPQLVLPDFAARVRKKRSDDQSIKIDNFPMAPLRPQRSQSLEIPLPMRVLSVSSPDELPVISLDLTPRTSRCTSENANEKESDDYSKLRTRVSQSDGSNVKQNAGRLTEQSNEILVQLAVVESQKIDIVTDNPSSIHKPITKQPTPLYTRKSSQFTFDVGSRADYSSDSDFDAFNDGEDVMIDAVVLENEDDIDMHLNGLISSPNPPDLETVMSDAINHSIKQSVQDIRSNPDALNLIHSIEPVTQPIDHARLPLSRSSSAPHSSPSTSTPLSPVLTSGDMIVSPPLNPPSDLISRRPSTLVLPSLPCIADSDNEPVSAATRSSSKQSNNQSFHHFNDSAPLQLNSLSNNQSYPHFSISARPHVATNIQSNNQSSLHNRSMRLANLLQLDDVAPIDPSINQNSYIMTNQGTLILNNSFRISSKGITASKDSFSQSFTQSSYNSLNQSNNQSFHQDFSFESLPMTRTHSATLDMFGFSASPAPSPHMNQSFNQSINQLNARSVVLDLKQSDSQISNNCYCRPVHTRSSSLPLLDVMGLSVDSSASISPDNQSIISTGNSLDSQINAGTDSREHEIACSLLSTGGSSGSDTLQSSPCSNHISNHSNNQSFYQSNNQSFNQSFYQSNNQTVLDFSYSLAPNDLLSLGSCGVGQHGTVQRAYHLTSLRRVALKTMSVYAKESRHQLMKELNTFSKSQSNNDHIVKFLGANHHQGQILLASEYCDAGSLTRVVESIKLKRGTSCDQQPLLPESTISHIARSILLGLDTMHRSHLIHRDLKPDNILCQTNGCVKIGDFGLTLELEHTRASVNAFSGTLLYLSPERVCNEAHSFPSDIWGVGIITAFVASGNHPHSGNGFDTFELAQRRNKQRHELGDSTETCVPTDMDKTKYSAELIDFLSQCLRLDPYARSTAAQLLQHPFVVMHSDSLLQRFEPLPVNMADLDIVMSCAELRNKCANDACTIVRIADEFGVSLEEIVARLKRC